MEDHNWILDLCGSEAGEYIMKKADTGKALKSLLHAVKNQYKRLDDTTRSMITWGAGGAGAAGLLSALSPERPGEDAGERTARILRNALLGGITGTGAAYAIPTGIDIITAPQNETPRSKAMKEGENELLSLRAMGTGGVRGGALGYLLGVLGIGNKELQLRRNQNTQAAFNRLAKGHAIDTVVDGMIDANKRLVRGARFRGAFRPASWWSLAGAALPLIAGNTNKGTEAYLKLKEAPSLFQLLGNGVDAGVETFLNLKKKLPGESLVPTQWLGHGLDKLIREPSTQLLGRGIDTGVETYRNLKNNLIGEPPSPTE